MTTHLLSVITAAVGLVLAPAAATAQGAAIDTLVIGEDLLDKRDDYGPRDIAQLEAQLREDVETRLGEAGRLAGAGDADILISLTLEDAWPNRPTRAQLSARAGLSYDSVERGGARVSATLRDRDGREIGQAQYEWRTLELADSAHRSTWADADRTLDRFAGRLLDALPETEADR